MENNQETNKEMEIDISKYEGSPGYFDTLGCHDPEKLKIRKGYAERAIMYFIRENNESQVKYFRDASKHINQKIQEIEKDLNPYTVKEKHLEFIHEVEAAKQEYRKSTAFKKVASIKDSKGLESFKQKVLKFIERSNYRKLDCRIWIECLKHINKRLNSFQKEEFKAWN
jgi:hypothetical protein